MSDKRDYYEVLGVQKGASDDEIKAGKKLYRWDYNKRWEYYKQGSGIENGYLMICNKPFAATGMKLEGEFAHDAAAAERAFHKRVPKGVKIGIVIAFIAIFFISFMLGRYPVMPVEWFQGVGDHIRHFFDPSYPIDQTLDNVLFKIRFPRIIVVLLVGAALSVSVVAPDKPQPAVAASSFSALPTAMPPTRAVTRAATGRNTAKGRPIML